MHGKCMAVKTITIDVEAYEMLTRHKEPGQSFSRVIKEHFGRAKKGRDLRAAVDRLGLREDAIEAIANQVRQRRRNPARVPRF